MVRISFVVGGGKGCRQKYSDELPNDFRAALINIGFDEDKGADLDLSCAGKFKFQHDTSKNLKFVHVYPRVEPPAAAEGDDAEGGGAGASVQREPADVLAECDMPKFSQLVQAHVGTYGTKRVLLSELRSRLEKVEAAERKLIAREPMDAAEQALYETLTIDSLKEKSQLLTTELQAAVEAGQLTARERTQLLEELGEKLARLDVELEKASADGKPKLKQKIEEQREKLQRNRATVSDATPLPLPPLKHGAEIRNLNAKVHERRKLEKLDKYTVEQLKRLGEIPELEEAIAILEGRSRLWFEPDEVFQERLAALLREGGGAKTSKAAVAKAAQSSDGFTSVKKKR